MPITPDWSIYYADTGTPMSAEAISAAEANSVEAALDTVIGSQRQIRNFKWANAAARTAQTGMTEGDIGDQADTDIRYRYSGSAWVNVSAGVVPLGSGVLNAVSSFAIDNLTGFDEYEITLDLPTSSVANQLSVVQLRLNGVADASANYDSQRDIAAAAVTSASSALAQTSWTIANGDRADKYMVIRLSSLNATRRTVGLVDSAIWDAAANPARIDFAIRHRLSSGYNGIGFTVSTGTVTGYYSVRGIRST